MVQRKKKLLDGKKRTLQNLTKILTKSESMIADFCQIGVDLAKSNPTRGYYFLWHKSF